MSISLLQSRKLSSRRLSGAAVVRQLAGGREEGILELTPPGDTEARAQCPGRLRAASPGPGPGLPSSSASSLMLAMLSVSSEPSYPVRLALLEKAARRPAPAQQLQEPTGQSDRVRLWKTALNACLSE